MSELAVGIGDSVVIKVGKVFVFMECSLVRRVKLIN